MTDTARKRRSGATVRDVNEVQSDALKMLLNNGVELAKKAVTIGVEQ